jgi:hypothetical protein
MRKSERVPDVKRNQTQAGGQKARGSTRRAGAASGWQPIEQLESRRLLAVSGGVFDPGNIPDNTPTTSTLTDTKDGPLANAGLDLINLYREFRRYDNAGGAVSKFDRGSNGNLLVRNGRVAVTIRGRDGATNLSAFLKSQDAEVVATSDKFSAVQAWVPLTRLRTISIDDSVAAINPIYRGYTNSVGVGNNQADETQLADKVRQIYGLDGTGVKIGILSDSVNLQNGGIGASVATGDLPADGIQIIEEGDPAVDPNVGLADEGRAMAELIHDIAPGAKLYFATGANGLLDFADNVRALRDAGCTIIVDDIGYYTESYFQPSVLDQAISEFVQGGGVYLSAAGNSGADGYQDVTRFVKQGGKTLLDFDPSSGIDTRLRITVNNTFGFLQWDNPYNGVAGNTTADLDIFFFNPNYPTRLMYSFSTNNLKTGVPIEAFTMATGTYDVEIRLSGQVPGQPAPKRFKFIIPSPGARNGSYVPGINSIEYSGEFRSGIVGHNGGADTISVGAVGYFNVPPYVSPSTTLISEAFSSQGPVTQVFDADGNRLPTPLTLQKPDISGIDGGNTSFFAGSTTALLPLEGDDVLGGLDPDSLPNFYGTSAAAPDVAAVVALMRQAAPHATRDQILAALSSTARPLNGASKGQWDAQGGYGLIDALSAVRQFVTKPTAKIIPLSQDPNYGPVNRIKVVFSQQVSGFDVSSLFLSLEGGPNLLTGDNQPHTVDGGRTWYIRNLSGITGDVGQYTLDVADPDGVISNAIGLTLASSTSLSFKILPVPTVPQDPSDLSGVAESSTLVRLNWTDNSNSESGFIIERAEDTNFKTAFKSFKVGNNVTSFNDTSLPAGGRTLYYRVRAINVLGDVSGYSNVAMVPSLSPGEVILDNGSSGVTRIGSWSTEDAGSGFLGSDYLDDGDAGKGSRSVKYQPTIAATAEYYVYARWVRSGDNATNVPVDIYYGDGGKRKTVTVNQRRSGGSGWVLLGKFTFNKGKQGYVQIRNAGTDGHVIADAIRFLPAS